MQLGLGGSLKVVDVDDGPADNASAAPKTSPAKKTGGKSGGKDAASQPKISVPPILDALTKLVS